MKVIKEGIYRDKTSAELPVVNVGGKHGSPDYFRAFFKGGYYNVNQEPENEGFEDVEWEMAEFVRELENRS